MGAAPKFAIATALLGCLTLAGCADCFDDHPAVGFVASPLHWRHRHHTAVVEPDPVTTTSSTSSVSSALSKCNQALYLTSAGSPEEMRAIEEKCRTIIIGQPY